MTTPLTVADFATLTERSGLLAPALLAPYGDAARDDPVLGTPDGLARALVRDRLLTPFQARQLLQGRHRGFFLTEKYKILDLLGEGGMGRVLLCEHLMLHRLVAVKVLTGEVVPGAAERFLREARAAAALDDPNVVRIFDVDRSPAGPFMVMEYVDGTNLHQVVAEHGPLSWERAAEYVRQAALGLQHASEMGLIHRDIKPGNLLLDRSGAVKLLDLGLARYFDAKKNDNLTQKFDEKNVLGTADFIAPEQAMDSSRVDIRADIYSLGCSFYYLLLRKFPFEEGSLTQKLLWHQTREPTPVREVRPDVPDGLARIVETMMKKDPADRFQSPADVVSMLLPWTARAVGPPPAHEMPKVKPAAYRLGLSPPPSSPRLGVADAATPSPSSAEAPTGVSPPRRPAARRPPATPAPTEPLPRADSWLPAPPRRRLLPLAVVGAVVLVGSAVGLYLATRTGDPPSQASTAPPPVVAPAPSAAAVELKGGGSTFVKPMMDRWAGLYQAKTGVKIEYGGGGSTQGVAGVTGKFLDFGCTEAPLTSQQLDDAGGEVVHVPLVLGAVVPTYNLTGPSEPLRFTGAVLANIYLGKVTRWDDDAIAAANPGVQLPGLPIVVVHRKEGSGTTAIWTEYLSKASGEWKEAVGQGTAVKWPVGQAAERNDGVADAVSRTVGAIGYVELSFAVERGLPAGRVKNGDGRFVAPTFEAVTAAAAAVLTTVPADLRYSLVGAPGPDSWPIAGTAWAVFRPGHPRAAEVVKFLRWATHDGQQYARELRYAPLPETLVKRIDEKLDAVGK